VIAGIREADVFRRVIAVVGAVAAVSFGAAGVAYGGNGVGSSAGTTGHQHACDALLQSDKGKAKGIDCAGPPTVSILKPTNGEEFAYAQFVVADYSCSPGANGGVLASCVGTVPNGSAIPTGVGGTYPFSVTATDTDGQQTTVTITYTVVGTTT
jgi:hypothetical protein